MQSMIGSSRDEIVREIVRAHARVDVVDVLESHVLTRDLGFDSLAFLLALSDLEDRLRFRFPLEEVDRLRDISVAELVRLVAQGGEALGG